MAETIWANWMRKQRFFNMYATVIMSLIAWQMLNAARANASTIVARNVEEMSARADAVVRATVVDRESMYQGDTIVTRMVLRVEERLKGTTESELTVWLPGGEINGIRAHISGVADYALDDDLIVFLEKIDDTRWRTSALSWSVYYCADDIAYRSSTEFHALSPSANPLLSTARTMGNTRDHRLSIDELRARIRAVEEAP